MDVAGDPEVLRAPAGGRVSVPFLMSPRELRTLVRRLKSSVLTVEEAVTLQRLRRRLEAALEGAEERDGSLFLTGGELGHSGGKKRQRSSSGMDR